MTRIDIRLFNAIGFQVLWFACLLLPGPMALVVALLFVCSHFPWVLQRDRYVRQVGVLAGLGIGIDLLYAWLGLLDFSQVSVGISLNLVALWVCFATTPTLCFQWLLPRRWLAVVLGAVFGPLSYLAGNKLGAVNFPLGQTLTLLIYAATWAVLMPLLLWLSQQPALAYTTLKEAVNAR